MVENFDYYSGGVVGPVDKFANFINNGAVNILSIFVVVAVVVSVNNFAFVLVRYISSFPLASLYETSNVRKASMVLIRLETFDGPILFNG